MKAIKGIAVFLAVLVFAAFICVMFLPVDSFVASRTSKLKGYKVPSGYTDAEYRYYYNNLSDKEQEAYRTVCAAFLSDADEFPKQIIVPKLSDNELENVYTALSYDNPEFFFLGNRCSMTKIGSIYYFVPQYLMSKAEYENSWKQTSAAADAVLAGIPSSAKTEYAKELYLHDWLVQNCEYDETLDTDVYTMHGVLLNKRANCEGYSRTMQYMLRALGIKNYLAVGKAFGGTTQQDAGHMWNIACIDGNYYNIDITWDDYSVTDVVDFPDNSVSHVYFNISSADLSENHSVDDEAVWAPCTAESYGYFRNSATYFSNYDAYAEHAMRDAIANSLAAGYNSVEFAFKDKTAYDNAFSNLIESGSMYNLITAANSRVSSPYRVDPTTVQYAMDEHNLILRFFFSR